MLPQAEREIEQLHAFFEGWFRGSLPATPQAFARFADVLDRDFVITTPDGARFERDPLLERLRSAHGGRGESLRIWVQDVRVLERDGDEWVVEYEEWQQEGESAPKGRRSVARFRAEDRAPQGLVWLSVHETWLPQG